MRRLFSWVLVLCLLLAGCSDAKAHTFDVQSGDKVTVTLDTTAGHKMSASGASFTIKKDGAETGGYFMEFDMIDDLFEWMPNNPSAEILESGKNEYGTYMLYSETCDGETLWSYVCTYDGTAIGVYLSNPVSGESLRDAVEHLSYSWEAAA